jgi:hypothetical protein
LAEQKGRCWVCHCEAPAERKRNFLCGECAHPDQVRFFCGRCGRRRTHDPAVAAKLSGFLPPDLELAPGTAVRLPYCPDCSSIRAPEPFQIEIYAIDS